MTPWTGCPSEETTRNGLTNNYDYNLQPHINISHQSDLLGKEVSCCSTLTVTIPLVGPLRRQRLDVLRLHVQQVNRELRLGAVMRPHMQCGAKCDGVTVRGAPTVLCAVHAWDVCGAHSHRKPMIVAVMMWVGRGMS